MPKVNIAFFNSFNVKSPQDRRNYIDTLSKYLEIHSTIANETEVSYSPIVVYLQRLLFQKAPLHMKKFTFLFFTWTITNKLCSIVFNT